MHLNFPYAPFRFLQSCHIVSHPSLPFPICISESKVLQIKVWSRGLQQQELANISCYVNTLLSAMSLFMVVYLPTNWHLKMRLHILWRTSAIIRMWISRSYLLHFYDIILPGNLNLLRVQLFHCLMTEMSAWWRCNPRRDSSLQMRTGEYFVLINTSALSRKVRGRPWALHQCFICLYWHFVVSSWSANFRAAPLLLLLCVSIWIEMSVEPKLRTVAHFQLQSKSH